MLGEKEDRRVKLYCQIVDDSGKLLSRRSLSIRRSNSIPWQASQSLDSDSTKPSATASGNYGIMAALLWAPCKADMQLQLLIVRG